MKSMLLAAGRGERLRPLTDSTAKPLIKANNKSLIEYHLDSLQSAGITEVVINTCWKAQKIVEQLGDGSRFGLNIQYSHEPKALETAGGISNALHLLGQDPFLLISADVWCDIDFTAISKPDTSQAHLVLISNPAHHSAGDFSLENGNVKLRTDTSLTYSGIGIFEPAMFKNLNQEKIALREVLIPAIANHRITGTRHNCTWFDIGTVERLQQLERYLKSENL